jgi:hypothetical protein
VCRQIRACISAYIYWKIEAANDLLKLNNIIDSDKSSNPSLNIITGSGMSYTRPDGINVISIAALGK